MADVVLKNKSGTPVTYAGVKLVQLKTTDGGMQLFAEDTGESGGGPDSLGVPDAYKSYVEEAKTQYTGDYAHLAILEGENKLNVAFLMDDFTLLTYNEKTTEFTAVGWLYCEYTKDSQTWLVVDHTTEASTGANYAKNIRYSSLYWEYNGQVIWPVGAGGGGESGGSGMEVSAHSKGFTDPNAFSGGPTSVPVLNIGAAFDSVASE